LLVNQLLTHSRLRAVRSCQRLHHLSYNLGYRAVQEQEALRFGSLIHKGLEAWFTAAPDARLPAALDAINSSPADPFDLARATVLLCGYDERWGGEAFETLAVEVQFRAPLVNPQTGRASLTFDLAGKLDAVVRKEGRVLLFEHKTSSEEIGVGSDYWKRLRMDGQVSLYFDGAASLGFDVEGCTYDVLRKPGLKPYKATPADQRKFTKDGRLYANQHAEDETPAEFQARLVEAVAEDPSRYYQRGEVTRLEAELDEARLDRWDLARQIREAQLAGRYPRNVEACVRFGTCQFFPACTGEASLEDPSLFHKLAVLHPELGA
jgi:hypothetical protein